MANTKAFLANVMDAYVYSGDQLLFTSKALTDSSISIGVTAEEVRGGKGNKLIGRYFHDSSFSMELRDALFNLEYIAYNVGSSIVTGTGSSLTEEQVTGAANASITVSGTPADFLGQGNIGWIAAVGSDNWAKFTFTSGSTATNVKLADNTSVVSGTSYCVKYMNSVACEELTVSANFVPSEVTVVLKGDLYKASKGNDVTTSSIIGHIEIDVPRFQLNGAIDLTLNSSGASQVPFSGQALVTYDSTAGCDSEGYYAIIKRIDTGAQWYDGLRALAIAGSDTITLAPSASQLVRVYGVYDNGSKLISPTQLVWTMTAGTATGTTVNSQTGVVTAGSTEGTGSLAITITGSTIATVATVTVQSA